eukprot:4720542-Amphidinium_carterae.1
MANAAHVSARYQPEDSAVWLEDALLFRRVSLTQPLPSSIVLSLRQCHETSEFMHRVLTADTNQSHLGNVTTRDSISSWVVDL